jgi:large subunit ribosomal protein L7/L12
MSRLLWSPAVTDIGDRIASLTLAHAAELQRYLEVAHGIRAAAAPVAPPKPPTPNPTVDTPAPTAFRVLLEDVDPTKKISVIKAVRELTGIGLKEAKDLVETAPKVVKDNVAREEAERVKLLLERAGARVSMVALSV